MTAKKASGTSGSVRHKIRSSPSGFSGHPDAPWGVSPSLLLCKDTTADDATTLASNEGFG